MINVYESFMGTNFIGKFRIIDNISQKHFLDYFLTSMELLQSLLKSFKGKIGAW